MSYKHGEQHHRAKYSEEDVELARQLADAGLGIKAIAKKLEVPRSTVRDWTRYMTRTRAA